MSFQDFSGSAPPPAPPAGTPEDAEAQAVVRQLFHMNTTLLRFQKHVYQIGTVRDSAELRRSLNQERDQLAAASKEVNEKLKARGAALSGRGSGGRAGGTALGDAGRLSSASLSSGHVAHEKLVKDFQRVLGEFQAAQRVCLEREMTYPPPQPKAAVATARGRGGLSAGEDGGGGGAGEQEMLLEARRRQEVVEMHNAVEFNAAIIEERDQGIREIQAQIVEVNEIFKDLAVLIHEQGEQIEDIEANITKTADHTVEANKQLAKAAKYQRSSRNMTFCLLFAVALLVIILLIFLTA